MTTAPEGRPFIAAGIVILVAGGLVAWQLGGWWIVVPVTWLPIAAWIPWFFRIPEVTGPRGEHLILAPADGKVVRITTVDESNFLHGQATRVSIFMNVFDVHVNRHPATGVARFRAYRPGAFFNATLDKASSDNERMLLGVESARGRILVSQIAGLIARRIVCDPIPGDHVVQGDRLGLIRFGSRVDTYFDPRAVLRVTLGDHTVAGSTILAEWPEESE